MAKNGQKKAKKARRMGPNPVKPLQKGHFEGNETRLTGGWETKKRIAT